MFKKIAAFVLLFALAMGSVSASSINGDYNGNPIIKITSSGEHLNPENVPAIIYEGNTLVPISILRQLGATVTWDQNTYSVDVTLPDNSKIDVESIMKIFGPNGKKQLLSYAQYMSNGNGYSQLNLVTNVDLSANDVKADYQMLMIMSGAVGATEIRIEDKSDYIKFIQTEDYVSFIRGELDSQAFASRIRMVNKNPVVSPPVTSTPNTIKSKIDGDFEGFDEGNIFELSNGQIWKQVNYKYKYAYKYSPEVLIYKDGISYYMKVDGVEGEVKVERLK